MSVVIRWISFRDDIRHPGIMCICLPPCACRPILDTLVLGVGAEDVGVTCEDVSILYASGYWGKLTGIEDRHDRAAEELTAS
jgi:hypothetical protein